VPAVAMCSRFASAGAVFHCLTPCSAAVPLWSNPRLLKEWTVAQHNTFVGCCS
jgi:hypothetical protein